MRPYTATWGRASVVERPRLRSLDDVTFDGDGRPPQLLVTDRFAAEVGEVGDGGEVGAGEREES